MFDANSAGGSELDAVTASLATRGVDRTQARWEQHWASALSNDDLHWLSHEASCTTIRLPVGYFSLGPAFCAGTPFAAPDVAHVYRNAWAAVCKLVSRCVERGIGVLLDLHALPGGANGEAHSGTSGGETGLWASKANLDLAARCLCYMAQEAVDSSMDGVVGIQLCNEAAWEAPGLYKFYDAVISKISQIDPGMPIYISDAWNLSNALVYARGKNSVKAQRSNPVIVDTHRYYTFAEKDTSRAPEELIAQVSTELSEVHGMRGNVFENKGACDVYVGEYSCTLSQQTWTKAAEGQRAQLTHQFGQAQSERWQKSTCGSAFWTIKMDWMPGGDWGFRKQVDDGTITPPANLRLPAAQVVQRLKAAEDVRNGALAEATQNHQAYWDRHARGTPFEHWRFADGWELGWADASDFFRARSTDIIFAGEGNQDELYKARKHNSDGADEIGVIELWVLKRMREVGCADKDTCQYGWEWEQGFRKGIDAFYTATGVS